MYFFLSSPSTWLFINAYIGSFYLVGFGLILVLLLEDSGDDDNDGSGGCDEDDDVVGGGNDSKNKPTFL